MSKITSFASAQSQHFGTRPRIVQPPHLQHYVLTPIKTVYQKLSRVVCKNPNVYFLTLLCGGKTMKKVTILLMLFAMVGIANANMLTNGDFEDPAGSGWSQWWGGNSNKYIPDPVESDHCAGVWWMDDGLFQGITIGPGTYTVSGQLMQEALGNGRIGLIKAEIGDGVNVWWSQEIQITQNDPALTWKSGSTVIDNTVAGATYLKVNLFMWDSNGWGSGLGIVRYDNISVTPEPATMALLGLGGAALLRRRK
jgi:hypothetical protein